MLEDVGSSLEHNGNTGELPHPIYNKMTVRASFSRIPLIVLILAHPMARIRGEVAPAETQHWTLLVGMYNTSTYAGHPAETDSYTGVSLLTFDVQPTGSFHLPPSAPGFAAGLNISWVVPHPCKPEMFYALSEVGEFDGNTSTGSIATMRRDKRSGSFSVLGRVPSAGGSPVHGVVDPTGRWLLVADYTGTLAVIPLLGNDTPTAGPNATDTRHQGAGTHSAYINPVHSPEGQVSRPHANHTLLLLYTRSRTAEIKLIIFAPGEASLVIEPSSTKPEESLCCACCLLLFFLGPTLSYHRRGCSPQCSRRTRWTFTPWMRRWGG